MSHGTLSEIQSETPVIERAEREWEWPAEAAAPSHDAIAKEAYALYAARGYQDGWAVEDWLAAEESLRHSRREE